jgi:hypothetical protein
MTSDKSYATEARVNSIFNAAGLVNPGAGGGGNGQRVTVFSMSDQLINNTADGVVTSLSVTVIPGAYRFAGKIFWTQPVGSSGITQALGFTGPAISHARIATEHYLNGSVPSNGTDIVSSLPGGRTTPGFANGTIYFDFDGIAVFTAGGTLSVVAHCNGANVFTVNSFSFMDVESVGQTS